MRILAFLLGRSISLETPAGLILTGAFDTFSAPHFPAIGVFDAYVEVHADPNRGGLPVDVVFVLTGPGIMPLRLHESATRIIPLSEDGTVARLRAKFPRVQLEFPAPGTYTLQLFVEGATAEQEILVRVGLPD